MIRVIYLVPLFVLLILSTLAPPSAVAQGRRKTHARALADDIRREIFRDLYPIFRSYYSARGYSRDNIDAQWRSATREFQRTFGRTYRSRGSRPSRGLPKLKPLDDSREYYSDDYQTMGDEFLLPKDRDDKEYEKAFLHFLTHDKEGELNEFGEFFQDMKKLEDDVNDTPSEWFKREKKSDKQKGKKPATPDPGPAKKEPPVRETDK